MNEHPHTPAVRSAEIREALVDLSPALLAAVPIALLVGAGAAAKGMSVVEVFLFSALNFAGGAQIAAIQLWDRPVPILAIVLSTALINARFVLMSASIAPKLAHLPLGEQLTGLFALVDENWALAERRAATRRISAAYFLGGAVVFWANWAVFSALGAIAGPLLGDPTRYGLDFAFPAIFIGLLAGFARRPGAPLVILSSLAAAALAHRLAGSPWHVLAGAFAGIGAAVVAAGRKDAPA
jgi:predicted branched-subunit amino acid permease